MKQDKKLTAKKVEKIALSFIKHIVDNWNFYKDNLANLRRTLMFYNEFVRGIRFLPENSNCAIEFNPRAPLTDDLPKIFGESYTEELGNIIYGAWPLRYYLAPWEGYKEVEDETPKTLLLKYPGLKNEKNALKHMIKDSNNYGDYKGRRVLITTSGTPQLWYYGFTTVEESPIQKEFLDSIRNNERISLGIRLMEEQLLLAKEASEDTEKKLKKLVGYTAS